MVETGSQLTGKGSDKWGLRDSYMSGENKKISKVVMMIKLILEKKLAAKNLRKNVEDTWTAEPGGSGHGGWQNCVES